MKGLRFRRSIKIAPGVRWNIGLKSSSISVGPRGAKLTVGSRGTRVTAGLPGTGLSVTRTVPSSAGQAGDSLPQDERERYVAQIPWDATAIERMGIDRRRDTAKGLIIGAGLIGMFGGFTACLSAFMTAGSWLFLAGLVVLIAGAVKPTAAQLALRERNRRIQTLLDWEVDATSRPSIEAALAKRAGLGLLPSEMPELDGLLERHDWEVEQQHLRQEAETALASLVRDVKAAQGVLPTIAGHERVVGRDDCYFVARAMYDKRGPNDEMGMLYLTRQKAIFMGDSRSEARWSKVVSVSRDESTLEIQRRDRQTPHLFIMESYSDALRAEYIARACLERSDVE